LTYLWIPDTDRKWAILDWFQEYRLGPLPLADDEEELVDDDRRGGLGVQLTHASNEHRPSDTSREAHDVGVNSSPLCPQLHSSESHSESAFLRHEIEDLVGYASTVERPQLSFIQTTQQAIIPQIQVWIKLLLDDPREDQINADVGVLELDNWNKGICDNGHVGNGSLGCHFDEQFGKMLEIVLARNVFWRDNEGIDIRTGTVDAKQKAAVGEHLADCISNKYFVVRFLLSRDLLNEGIADLLERLDDLLSVQKFLVSVTISHRSGRIFQVASPLFGLRWSLERVLSFQFVDERVCCTELRFGRQVGVHGWCDAVHLIRGHDDDSGGSNSCETDLVQGLYLLFTGTHSWASGRRRVVTVC
jgi:hypothetical protein